MMGLARYVRNLGIRAQLTLWYIAVFTILILIFGTIFYVNLSTSLSTSFDSSLEQRTEQIAAGISEQNGKIVISDGSGELLGLIDSDDLADTNATPQATTGTEQQTEQEPEPNVDVDVMVRVLNKSEQIIYVSSAFRTLNVPSESFTQPFRGTSWQGTVIAQNGYSVRLYSIPLVDNGKVFGVVQVGEPLASLDTTLRSILIEFLLIVPFILLFGALGSYWLAAHAFGPIQRLTRTAQQIEAEDLHQRVPVPRARDEVQNLALTFNDMIERLDKAFTQQRRFVADASHELRTPVAAIRSMIDVTLAQGAGEEEAVHVLSEVNVVTERLGHLINDLLTLARADEGQTLLERKPVRLDLLATDVAASTELLAAEQDIAVTVDTSEPVLVLGDEVRLIQVILNLLQNALVYTNAGGKISLKVEARDNNALLSIRDTGIGIAPEHLEHIFERFYRADAARSRAVGGSGLGLAIVDWIVHAHKGTISVESEVGKGALFTVSLPLENQA
ncbi:MAG TPA: ATP-binding protein [Ktedonobacteraceae bacterium]|nr:ATP-binding protein [Ktedonobacteraceae bacterium]